jgi:polyribonucleotide 5'-hydroxyl-kinase
MCRLRFMPCTACAYFAGAAPRPPSSALPLGQTAAAAPLKVTPVLVTSDLEQALLAVSHAPVPDQLLSSNIAGFVHVHEVDVKQNTVTVMLPTAAAMPGSYVLVGNIKMFMV